MALWHSSTYHSFPSEDRALFDEFFSSYLQALEGKGLNPEEYAHYPKTLLEMIAEQVKNPFSFTIYHERILEPFNYYQWGLDFFRPLIDFQQSKLLGEENLQTIERQRLAGENIILLANHQSELDPQVLSLLLEKKFPAFAEEMIFVAGHRVVTDPVAVPFSKGRNLLCIYSKRHVDHPPERRAEKLQHNQRTMKKMVELLNEGGRVIYVAPSGGRDRADEKGEYHVTPFNPQSLSMFLLMTQQSKRPCHFYPLALLSYPLLPPPAGIKKELGERRQTQATPIHAAFGEEVFLESLSQDLPKKARRQAITEKAWNLVKTYYQRLQS